MKEDTLFKKLDMDLIYSFLYIIGFIIILKSVFTIEEFYYSKTFGVGVIFLLFGFGFYKFEGIYKLVLKNYFKETDLYIGSFFFILAILLTYFIFFFL